MYIAIEWTSSAFHAWLMHADGTVAKEHRSAAGVNTVKDRTYEATLRAEIGDWLDDAKAILLSGMVTSRTGWVESSFAMVPAGLSDLLQQAERKQVAGMPQVHFLPGIARLSPLPDVMRGEEMAVFGMDGPLPDLVILPGAHTKWVRTDGTRIIDLTTYMSGEILALLLRDSLVSRLIPKDYTFDQAAFDKGVEVAMNKASMPGGVLQRVFSARSLVLFDQLQPAEINAYLTGVIIGSEVAEALSGDRHPNEVAILGQTQVAGSYRRALARFGVAPSERASESATGFGRLIRMASDL